MIVIENVRILSRGKQFSDNKIIIDRNKIREIIPASQPVSDANCQIIDARHYFTTAGFIDLHLHGDSDLPVAAQNTLLDRMLTFQAENGVTGIYPSQIPLPKNDYENLRLMRAKAEAPPARSTKILGIHLEGPFLNPKMRGGFTAGSLIPPSLPLLKYWRELTGDRVVRMTLSPEVPGNIEIAKYLTAEKIAVSLGHTNAAPDIIR